MTPSSPDFDKWNRVAKEAATGMKAWRTALGFSEPERKYKGLIKEREAAIAAKDAQRARTAGSDLRMFGLFGADGAYEVLVDAMKAYDAAVQLSPNFAEALCYRGGCRYDLTMRLASKRGQAKQGQTGLVYFEIDEAVGELMFEAYDDVMAALALGYRGDPDYHEMAKYHLLELALRKRLPALRDRVTRPLDVEMLLQDLRSTAGPCIEAAGAELVRRGVAVVPRIQKCLVDETGPIRGKLAIVLNNIGPPAAAAAPQLTALLQDPDPRVRDIAAQALRRINGGLT